MTQESKLNSEVVSETKLMDELPDEQKIESNIETTGSSAIQEEDKPNLLEDVDEDENVQIEDVHEEEEEEKGLWYILQCYSGQEFTVQARVQEIIDSEAYRESVFRVLVPTEDTVEIKNNKRVEKTVRIYPGYIFICMEYDDEIFYKLRQLPGVSKFIGTHNRPTPVEENEILKVLRKVGDRTKRVDVDFEIGEVIKVESGPFRGYTGVICEINTEKGTLKAKISVFGRETPVGLEFDQVEKAVK